MKIMKSIEENNKQQKDPGYELYMTKKKNYEGKDKWIGETKVLGSKKERNKTFPDPCHIQPDYSVILQVLYTAFCMYIQRFQLLSPSLHQGELLYGKQSMWYQHSHLLQEHKLDETNPAGTQSHAKSEIPPKDSRFFKTLHTGCISVSCLSAFQTNSDTCVLSFFTFYIADSTTELLHLA